MKIVFLTSGKGSGHVVLATSLFNALKRVCDNFEFILMGNFEYDHLCPESMLNYQLPMEPQLYVTDPRSSQLYLMMNEIRPDYLVTDGLWFPLHNMLHHFDCKKIIFFRQSLAGWFKLESDHFGTIEFDPHLYDHCYSIEPGFTWPGLEPLNPFVIKNRSEVLSKKDAREALGIGGDKKVCLLAHNGYEGELETLKIGNSHFDSEYQVITTSNSQGEGLFPLADYLNGIDLLVGAGGYNLFYEALYFQKKFTLIPQKRPFEDQNWRIEKNSDLQFVINGADQLVAVILGED